MKTPQEIAPRTRRKSSDGERQTEPGRKPAPTVVDLVWVQCRGYRCLAYFDARGKWVSFYTGKVLTDVVDVIG